MTQTTTRRQRVLRVLAVLSVAAATFLSGAGQVLPSAQATMVSQESGDYLLEISPSAADEALWNLARQSLNRVNVQALQENADQSSQMKAVANAYFDLTATVGAAQKAPSVFVLSSVPVTLMKSFEEGNLPQAALFSAAGKVEPVIDIASRGPQLQVVSVTRVMAEPDAVFEQISELETAVGQLDELSKQVLAGDVSGFLSASGDEELQRLVTNDFSAVAAAAQKELDQRLAQNLPDLSGYSNGQLPDDTLCQISWAPADRLQCAAMDNFVRLNEDFKAEFGKDLPILDGYRPLEEQLMVHYNDPNWTAVPGTSNHGWGLAVDFDWDVFSSWDAPEVVWMIENGPQFGWRLPSALGPQSDRPEPWHYEFGTSYSGDSTADFIGPTPSVVYRVKTA